MPTILELANKHMLKCKFGGSKVRESPNVQLSTKDVVCIMCGRNMTTTKDENPPYYCYKCHDEAEGVFGRG